ncbi:MAG: phage tail tape measure protein, partial [Magnetospirillum sp.]|nr:phage tail tape measure protein [Magnetospirillum sp.]
IGAVLKDGFATAFSKAGIAATKLDDIIQTVDTRIVTMKGWAAAKKETAAAKEEWERATAKAKALAAQLAATANPTEDLKNKVAAARKEADQAKAAFMGTATGLKAMDVQLKAAGVSIRTVKVELDAAEKSMAALTHRREALTKAMAAKTANTDARAGLKGQVIETVALGAALAAPINKAIEFETAMADVRKAVDFQDGAKGLKAMEAAIMDMAKTTPMAHKDIAAIITAGGKAGIAEKDLRVYAETVSKLAVAWDMAPDAVGTSMGKISNVLKIGVGDLMLVGDAINKLADSGNSNESEIVDVLKRISGVGLQAHLSAQQLSALSATFIDLGAAPEVAATGINSMLQKLLAAPAGTKKFKEGLQEIGWAADDMQQSMLKDSQGTLVKFLESLQDLDEAKRANLMADMFGAEYSDDMARLIGGLDTYRKHLKTVSDEANDAGSTMQTYGIYAGTTASRLKLAANTMNAGAIKNGTGLLGVVKDVADTFSSISSSVGNLAGNFPTLTKAIVYTTAALIGYKVAKLAVSFAAMTIKGAVLDTRIAFNKTAAAATIASTKFRGVGIANTGMAR